VPFVIIFGVIFFGYKLFVDAHVLLNNHRSEMESSGIVLHNACLKIIAVLAFFHFAIFIKYLGEKKLEACLILICLFSFTVFVWVLYSKPFLRPGYFKDEPVKVPSEALEKWYEFYSHPLASNHEYSRLVEMAYTNALIVPQNKHLP